MLVAELNRNLSTPKGAGESTRAVGNQDFQRIIGLLETRDAEAMVMVAQFLAQHRLIGELRIGTTGEVPEPASLVGAFSLVACDFQPTCPAFDREAQQACAYAGYCSARHLRGAVRQLPRLALVVQPGDALSRRDPLRDRHAQLEPARPPEADRREVQRGFLSPALPVARWYRRDPAEGVVVVSIHAQPQARRTEVVGLHGDSLKVRVAAPALENRANEALIAFVARALRRRPPGRDPAVGGEIARKAPRGPFGRRRSRSRARPAGGPLGAHPASTRTCRTTLRASARVL